MKRLQRDLCNSCLPSGISFVTSPSSTAPASKGRSNSTRRLEQGSTRYGHARSAGSVSSPSRLSLGEDGGSCREGRFGGILRDNAGERGEWIEGKWQREERGTRVASGGDKTEEKDLVSPTRTVTRRRSSRLRPDEVSNEERAGVRTGLLWLVSLAWKEERNDSIVCVFSLFSRI